MKKLYSVPYITITNIDIENQLCVNSVPSAGHEGLHKEILLIFI